MDFIPDWSPAKLVVAGVACIVGFYLLKFGMHQLIWYMTRRGVERMPDNYEQDVVYLHTFPRNLFKGLICISPFGLKLETWLRMNKIKHHVIQTRVFSKSTGQIPYIILNGSEVADSSLIIEHLTDVFELDSTEGLTHEQQGARQAFVAMMDEHFVWSVFLPRYVYKNELFTKFLKFTPYKWVNASIRQIMKTSVLRKARLMGIGRKSPETVARLGNNDVRAISKYLGKKKYMMGDKMTMVDCSIFGHLAQVVYCDFPYEHKTLLEGECSNLMSYMERIKENIWPDWDDIAVKAEAA